MIITADWLIPGDGRTVLERQAVALSEKDGQILEYGPVDALERKYGEKATTDYGGCTVLPGLIDLHVHISAWGDMPFGYAGSDFVHAYITLRNARKAFESGVTTLRSVADKNKLVASLVWAADHQVLDEPIPRIIPCGNGICMTGGHGSEFPGGGDIVDGPWEMRKRIRRTIQEGAQWIKLLTSRRAWTPEFTQEELDAAVDEAHRLGHKIAVHSGVPVTIQMCIDAGVDTIEHGTFMSEEQAKQMVEKGIACVPTVMVYSEAAKDKAKKDPASAAYYEGARTAYFENLKRYYDMGVLIGAGTDVPVDMHGVNTYFELEYLVRCGLTPLQAIEVGTGNGARILGMEDRIGQIQPGLEADLLVVRGDASRDITALRQVEAVYQRGRLVYGASTQ